MDHNQEDTILNQLPKWLEKSIADYRTSVEMYRLNRSGETIYKIGKMYQISPQNAAQRINKIKMRLREN